MVRRGASDGPGGHLASPYGGTCCGVVCLTHRWLYQREWPFRYGDCPMSEAQDRDSGAAMVAAALQTHLEQIEKPLRYAARQNFANLTKLRDLEAYVQHHVQALQALPLPAALYTLLQRLLQAMHGVDALSLPQKQER